MSNERDTLVLSESGAVSQVSNRELLENTIVQEEGETAAEFKARKRALTKARLVRVLERGQTADRLHVELPEGVHGEWVSNDEMSIASHQLKGFELDTQYASARSLHSDGSGKAIVGDVIFMTCSQDNKDLLDEIGREMYINRHGDPRKRGKRDKEEKAENRAASSLLKESGLPVIDESDSVSVGASEIQAAVNEAK